MRAKKRPRLGEVRVAESAGDREWTILFSVLAQSFVHTTNILSSTFKMTLHRRINQPALYRFGKPNAISF